MTVLMDASTLKKQRGLMTAMQIAAQGAIIFYAQAPLQLHKADVLGSELNTMPYMLMCGTFHT